MGFAVCIECGQTKRRPEAACRACGFTPCTDEDKAKSLILSVYYEFGGEYRGYPRAELEAIAAAIRAGKPYHFSSREVGHATFVAARVLDTSLRRLALDGLRWLAPSLALLALATIAWWLAG